MPVVRSGTCGLLSSEPLRRLVRLARTSWSVEDGVLATLQEVGACRIEVGREVPAKARRRPKLNIGIVAWYGYRQPASTTNELLRPKRWGAREVAFWSWGAHHPGIGRWGSPPIWQSRPSAEKSGTDLGALGKHHSLAAEIEHTSISSHAGWAGRVQVLRLQIASFCRHRLCLGGRPWCLQILW